MAKKEERPISPEKIVATPSAQVQSAAPPAHSTPAKPRTPTQEATHISESELIRM